MSFIDNSNYSDISSLLSNITQSLINSKAAINVRGGSADVATGFANLEHEIASIPLREGEEPIDLNQVLSVNGQLPNENGNVSLTASMLGAALLGCNWQSATSEYRTTIQKQVARFRKAYEEGTYDDPGSINEEFADYTPEEYLQYLIDTYITAQTPQRYLFNRTQGCRFIRIDPAYGEDSSDVLNPDEAGLYFCIMARLGGEYVKDQPAVEGHEAIGNPGDDDYQPAVEPKDAVIGYDNRQYMRAFFFLPFDSSKTQTGFAQIGPFKELKDPEDPEQGYVSSYKTVLALDGLFNNLTFYMNGKPLADRQWVEEQLESFDVFQDVSDDWQEYEDYDENAGCTSNAVKDFLWSLSVGQYKLILPDGNIYMTALAEEDNTVKYRWLQVFSDAEEMEDSNSLKVFEVTLYENNTSLFTLCKDSTGSPYVSVNGTRLASISDLANLPTIDNIRSLIFDEYESQLAVSNVRTTITKCRRPRPDVDVNNDDIMTDKRQLKIVIENNNWLINQINAGKYNINDCKLVFMMNSRRRGKSYHWWHPDTYYSEDYFNRIGYGLIAGSKTKRVYFIDDESVEEIFPETPSWMPNNGYMETEIPLTYEDLTNGYVFINPRSYFLPMIKPIKPIDLLDSNGNSNENWGTNIAFVSTSSKIGPAKSRPILCSFAISIDGDIMPFNNAIKVGCMHDKNQLNSTSVVIDNEYSYIDNLYTSIV